MSQRGRQQLSVPNGDETRATAVIASTPRSCRVAALAAVALGISSIGVGLASRNRSGLAWDGAAYLFKILRTGRPVIVHGRVGVLPMHLLVLVISGYTSNVNVLASVFTMVYLAVPLGALLASAVLMRDNCEFFTWPAIGLFVALLPGEPFVVSEAVIAAAVSWPLASLVVTGLGSTRRKLALVALALILTSIHPSSGILLCGVAGLAWWRGRQIPGERATLWWAAVLLAALGTVRTAMISRGYETDSMHGGIAEGLRSVLGTPALLLICVAAFSVTQMRPIRRLLGDRALWAVLPTTLVAGAVMTWWSATDQWASAPNYRFVCAGLTLLLFVPLGLEVGSTGRSPKVATGGVPLSSAVVVVGAAVIFALTLGVQGDRFAYFDRKVAQKVNAASKPCIDPRSLAAGYPIDNFSVSYLAVLQQGRTPTLLAVDAGGCALARAGIIELPYSRPFDVRDSGWFAFDRLLVLRST